MPTSWLLPGRQEAPAGPPSFWLVLVLWPPSLGWPPGPGNPGIQVIDGGAVWQLKVGQESDRVRKRQNKVAWKNVLFWMSPKPLTLMYPNSCSSVHDLLFPRQNIMGVGPYVSFPMNLTLMMSVSAPIKPGPLWFDAGCLTSSISP
uniref:Uncharacterized protein n=1 Tax=Rousettus aegyptiacus TaxID=9407 RepID=A0A7J8CIU2_ROUAE|nr:hypothetical protein HJG63_009194 [Rousettus aegyptiacus]